MSRISHARGRPNARKSYTLSPESVAFLETLRQRHRARSISAVLEEILQSARRAQEKKTVEKSVSDYYDSLSAEEGEEHARWGDFALSEFPHEAG
jgi:hypothetical protein